MTEAVSKVPVEGPIDTPDKHVAEALRHAQVIISNTFEGERLIDDMQKHGLAVAALIADFGLAFLMETLRRVAPEVAERAARELWSIYDDGGAVHELVWSWRNARDGDPDSRAWFEKWFAGWSGVGSLDGIDGYCCETLRSVGRCSCPDRERQVGA